MFWGCDMSFAVARMQKMKVGNLGGAYKHNERVFKNHANKDIDTEKSDLNYELTDRNRSISYEKQITDYVNDNKISDRAIRKDAVLCDEWIITSDSTFFENLSPERTREYFEANKQYFAENFGDSNVAYASVHMDESTPHMHLGIVPMENGKLSSKAMFDKKTLLKIQDELPKYLQDKGFDVERGRELSQAKHMTVSEFKENLATKELHETLDKMNIPRTESVVEYDDGGALVSVEPKEIGIDKRLDFAKDELSKKQLELSKVREQVKEVKTELIDLEDKSARLDIEIEQQEYQFENSVNDYSKSLYKNQYERVNQLSLEKNVVVPANEELKPELVIDDKFDLKRAQELIQALWENLRQAMEKTLEKMFSEREKEITAKESKLDQKFDQLAEREQFVAEKEKSLNAVEEHLEEQLADIQEQRERIQKANEIVKENGSRIVEREKELDRLNPQIKKWELEFEKQSDIKFKKSPLGKETVTMSKDDYLKIKKDSVGKNTQISNMYTKLNQLRKYEQNSKDIFSNKLKANKELNPIKKKADLFDALKERSLSVPSLAKEISEVQSLANPVKKLATGIIRSQM